MSAVDYAILPTVNACLNGCAALCLLAGWFFVRAGRTAAHRAAMLAALTCSVLFLISYLVYHAHAGSRPFQGVGAVRVVYLVVLGTHSLLAAAIVPLVVMTVTRALRGRFPQHRAIARWTLPLWLYVSITGVIVYAMLYHWPTR